MYLKQSRLNRVKNGITCSLECAYKLKSEYSKGELNHQFGLKGDKNASFINKDLKKKNHKKEDIKVYVGIEHPDADVNGRVLKHRLEVQENYELYDPKYFETKNNYVVLKDKIHVHHVNLNHNDNKISNLIPLHTSNHTKLHGKLRVLAEDTLINVIGVLKQGELLGTPEEENQQLSLNRNVFKSSETIDRVLLDKAKDSNIDTSALLNKLLMLIDDYIVQTVNITNEIAEL